LPCQSTRPNIYGLLFLNLAHDLLILFITNNNYMKWKKIDKDNWIK